jgi:hypothetical protein
MYGYRYSYCTTISFRRERERLQTLLVVVSRKNDAPRKCIKVRELCMLQLQREPSRKVRIYPVEFIYCWPCPHLYIFYV